MWKFTRLEQPAKTLSPKYSRAEPKYTSVKEVQFLNASQLILRTPEPIVTVLRLVQSAKALLYISCILSGITIFSRLIQPPRNPSGITVILELKVNHTPEEAIAQIKERKYALRFRGKLGEEPKYTGRILGVGIVYDKESKKHSCIVEEL